MYCARTKHIGVRFHKNRELVSSGELLLEKIHTSENAIEMLTKFVTTEKFKHYLDLINISRCLDLLPLVEFSSHVWFLQRGEYSQRWRLLWHVAHFESKRGQVLEQIDSTAL